MISRASALLVTAALLGACSSNGAAAPAKATNQVLIGTPALGTTACSALPRKAVEQIFGAPITQVTPSRSGRAGENLQTACVVSVKGEQHTTLAVYLWYGSGLKEQWTSEVNFVGTDGFTDQPYGVEGYGSTQAYLTNLDVRERNFAVRLVCGATVKAPATPIGIANCAKLVDAMAEGFPSG